MVLACKVAAPDEYGSHDFRRGHAKASSFRCSCDHVVRCTNLQDLQKSKHPLATICGMGGWKMGAGGVVSYLDQCELEQDVTLEAALLSEEEEWID